MFSMQSLGQAPPADASVTTPPHSGSLVYSTYLGGENVDAGYGIAVDSQSVAVVTGITSSTMFPVFPPPPGPPLPFEPGYGGGPSDAFVTKIV
jgi:hypothetical protein